MELSAAGASLGVTSPHAHATNDVESTEPLAHFQHQLHQPHMQQLHNPHHHFHSPIEENYPLPASGHSFSGQQTLAISSSTTSEPPSHGEFMGPDQLGLATILAKKKKISITGGRMKRYSLPFDGYKWRSDGRDKKWPGTTKIYYKCTTKPGMPLSS